MWARSNTSCRRSFLRLANERVQSTGHTACHEQTYRVGLTACAAWQMLAKRQAMGDQEPSAAAGKRKRDADSDDDDDDSDGGGRRERDTDQRRRKAKEGGSKTAAVKPSKQVFIAVVLHMVLSCVQHTSGGHHSNL